VTVTDRLAEITARYGLGHRITRAITASAADIAAAASGALADQS